MTELIHRNLEQMRAQAIKETQERKEQQFNHYSVQQASDELEDLLTTNRMYTFKDVTNDFIKRLTGRDGDSYTIRETGKFISELINKFKEKYEVKE